MDNGNEYYSVGAGEHMICAACSRRNIPSWVSTPAPASTRISACVVRASTRCLQRSSRLQQQKIRRGMSPGRHECLSRQCPAILRHTCRTRSMNVCPDDVRQCPDVDTGLLLEELLTGSTRGTTTHMSDTFDRLSLYVVVRDQKNTSLLLHRVPVYTLCLIREWL